MAINNNELPKIDFAALNAALLPQIRQLLPLWLPGGQVVGTEYVAHSLWRSEKTASLKVSVLGDSVGRWADFGGDRRGNDLVSLYAAIHDLGMGQAAVQLARDHGLAREANIVSSMGGRGSPPPPPPRPPAPPPAPDKPEKERWTTIMVVPPHAPEATFKHPAPERPRSAIVHTAVYRVDGHLLGYIVRFRTSDGGKVTIPYTWAMSERDGACAWKWRFWDGDRPLFYPGGTHPAGRTVVIVEGEKKAEALQELLDAGAPGIYCVVSWPGGSKAWKQALWQWIAGSTVILWPDCDGKRELLTKAERAQCGEDPVALAAAQASKPLLPANKQVGMVAMLGLGATLRDAHACTVSILPIPEPLEVPDGWDCYDAIHVDGWDFDRVLAFFGRAGPLPAAAEPKPAKAAAELKPAKKIDPPAEARPPSEDDFQDHVDFICEQLKCKPHDIGITRKLVIAALRKARSLQNCVGFDELRGAPCTREPWPWRREAGPLGDADDLRLGDYLSQEYGLKAASRAALTEAIDTVADEMRFHPVRDWLDGLTHDGKPRLDTWLIHVLGMDANKLKPRRKRYLELMGRYLLMGLVARVFEPGCKFDYSPVFEGPGGIGKSTFTKVLVGKEFFSDTHFDIGNGKDGMEQLEGLWAYELSEMTAFRRADSEQVKAFFSSTVDRFRGAYGKFVQNHPRQCVIFCTTNKRRYLYDLTGNRRFWPIWIGQRILLAWLQEHRAQLFAEAVQAYRKGDRYYPTPEDEETFFVPEQMKRLADTSVQSRLYEMLTREGKPSAEPKLSLEFTRHTTFLTLHGLVAALGADPAKSTTILENQVRSWLEFMGWRSGREPTGQRRRGYKAPAVWPPEVVEDDEDDDDEEAAPPPPSAPVSDDDGSPAQADPYRSGDDEPF